MQAPLTIIGMHRSGTTMLSRALARLGIFWGSRLDVNHEALFFIRLNNWLLHQAGASWDSPLSVDYLLKQPKVLALCLEYLRVELASPRTLSYLGAARFMRTRARVSSLRERWGWKDPRTTFTLPVWLRLYPNTRVIHVVRHGVDVAHSLATRQRALLDARTRRFHRLKPIYYVRRKHEGFTDSLRVADVEYGISLWRDYVERANAHVNSLGPQAMTIMYEDLLASPRDELARVARFAGLVFRDDELSSACGSIRPERAFAFRSNPELVRTALAHRSSLEALGYSAD